MPISKPLPSGFLSGLRYTTRGADEKTNVVKRGPMQPNLVCNAGDVPGIAVDRADALLPAELIHDDEVVILLLRPSLLYIPLASLGSLVFIALVTLALAYAARWVGWTDSQAFSLGATLAAVRLGWQTLEWWSRVYVLTDRRIIRRMGVVRVAIFETQLKQIQHTSIFVQLRERVFGLGSIGFATAGSDVFEAFWVMIRQPFAVHRVVVKAIERYR